MMEELKFTGNCLKSSRPVLSFDHVRNRNIVKLSEVFLATWARYYSLLFDVQNFEEFPHTRLLKELFTQVFGTPNYHPKSQPFVDHVFNFSILDGKIWFRNYQIVEENGELVEIGNSLLQAKCHCLSWLYGHIFDPIFVKFKQTKTKW